MLGRKFVPVTEQSRDLPRAPEAPSFMQLGGEGGHLLRTLEENLPFAQTPPSFLKFLGASSGAPLYCSLGFCFVGPCPGLTSAIEFSRAQPEHTAFLLGRNQEAHGIRC